MREKKKRRLFNEVFKKRLKIHIGKKHEVLTEFEILKLSRKIDVLIIQGENPINEDMEYLKIFQKFNIIEFKSVVDKINSEAINKMLFYSNGFLLEDFAITYYEELYQFLEELGLDMTAIEERLIEIGKKRGLLFDKDELEAKMKQEREILEAKARRLTENRERRERRHKALR